ncbi:hypothetical protein RDI58_028643 [Solanum bulbocastanum]|uniref:Retrotransposon gag domain-containing protein n=1 Tax=Solanum bulbocastanum TaxID=147425 RepID=A0AAN8SQM4_SOLBU
MAVETPKVLTRLDRMAIDMANVAARQNQLETVNEKSFSELKKAIEDGQGKQLVTTPRFFEKIYSPTIGPLGIPGIMNSVPPPPIFYRTTTSNPTSGGPTHQTNPSQKKVTIATLHFDDLALQWHQAYMRSRNHLSIPTWEEYIYALSDRFGAEFDDPMSELVSLRQTGSVISYQEVFNRAMTLLTLDPNHAISVFFEWAETGVRWREAMKNQPYSYAKPQTTPNLHLPKPPPPIVADRPRRRRLTPAELKEEGVALEEEGELLQLPEVIETCKISIHAMNGIKGYRTLRLTGHCHKKALNILIDTGSTHNFMDSGLVARIGWKVSPCNWGDAGLADGNSVPINGICQSPKPK